MSTAPRIYPTLRYDDCPAAIDFLTKALGFDAVTVMEEDGVVGHGLLAYDTGVVMVSSRRAGGDPIFDQGTACLYVAVDDPDAHHDHAVAQGADVVMALVDQDYGSREYAVRDPEGNVWVFGTYRPGAYAAN
jgi:uncharacterized glyoxalase superfamily protein PhnB